MKEIKKKSKKDLSVNYDDNEIRHLPPRVACRLRPSMFVGSTGGPYGANNIYTEILENAEDTISEGHGDTILTSTDFNGFIFVSDNGSGLPITMSLDKPNITSAELSISEFNSGNKFGESKSLGRIGMNGIGSSACNFLSAQYIVLSKITETNYNRSIPEVANCWNSAGPRSKKDLFYILVMEEGIKVFEGAGKLKDLEKQIFKGVKNYVSIPEGQSTIVLFKPDPKIFEDPRAEVPIDHLQYFILIQEKFYKRKVNVIVDGVSLRSTFSPFTYEIMRTIVPADNSANKQIGVYITFEVDPTLSKSTSFGSVNGLCCNEGIHINMFKNLFKNTLKDAFKIKYTLPEMGLKFCCVLLASECQYNSQTKEVLKQIVKVKPSDFEPIAKDIEKIFRKDPEYWGLYVNNLIQLAESLKSLGAADKAQKMIDATSGVSSYRAKADFPKTFADATSKDRSQCELFIVEGNSAQSSLVMGRKDTRLHACLGLRGKILNVTDKSVDRALESKVINDIFNIIGLGLDVNWVGKDAKSYEEAHEIIMKKSRYGKIIIATDAD